MSRWLKSVNNLLDNLDGQAEAITESVADASGGILLTRPTGNVDVNVEDSDSYYYEEELTDDDDFIDEEDDEDGLETDEDAGEPGFEAALDATTDDDEAVSIQARRRKSPTDDTVSDISFDGGNDDLETEVHYARLNDNSAGANYHSLDAPPKTPNRVSSHPKKVEQLQQATYKQQLASGTNHSNATATSNSRSPRSPHSLIDQSPRPPRRSFDTNTGLPAAGAELLETNAEEGNAFRTDAPKQPQRQSSIPASHKDNEVETRKVTPQIPPPPLSSAPTSGVSSNMPPTKSKDYAKLLAKYQALQKDHQASKEELQASKKQINKLTKQTQTLQVQLDSANAEITAQAEELRRAGERMEKDRLRAQEDREDLLDDHDDELDQLRESHEQAMDQLRQQYEQQIEQLTQRLEREEHMRLQEGGDASKDLQDAMQREKDAILKLSQVEASNQRLLAKTAKLESQQATLQSKFDSSLQSGKTAAEREREAEDKLDAALSLHSRQMSQRQAREAELEKTILELGAALTVARQQHKKVHPSAPSATDESYKEKYLRVAEEMETVKVQFELETQRREALQEEFNDSSKERAKEASASHAKQLQYDRKVADLESNIARLQATVAEHKGGKSPTTKGGSRNSNLIASELDDAKVEISRLSEQLLRHQGLAESAKAEILALKGRYKVAQTRAEEAEAALAIAQSSESTTSRLYDMESGVPTQLRRRVKGGARSRGGNRTIRSALQIGPGRSTSPFVEQIAQTLDAIDTWMVDTGSFMKHEPFARLGFLLYLATLHLWTFALVVFHETEVPHGDFGSMGNNPRHWRDHASSP